MSGKKRLFLAFAALVLLLVGGYWLWDLHTKSVLADAQQRLRDAHLPMTIADLRPPPVPDADNAALIIEKIVPLLDALPQVNSKDFQQWLSDFRNAHKELRLDKTAANELAEQFDSPPVQAVLVLIHEAAGKKGYDVGTDYTKRPSPSLSLLGPARRSVELLLWRARLLSSQGRAEEAGMEVGKMVTLGEFLANEPTMLSVLMGHAHCGMATEEIQRLAAADSISPELSRRFSDRLTAMEGNLSKALARAVDGERIIFGQPNFKQLLVVRNDVTALIGMKPDGWKERVRLQSYRLSGVVRQEYADYLDRMVELRAAALFASHDRDLLERRISNLAPVPSNRLILEMVASSIEGILRSRLRYRAQFVVTQAGLALERYRAAKGSYPVALTELAPEFIPAVPPDVFTGKPLLYRPEPGGALIYSLGPNQTDDGGVENRDDDKDDISWASGTAAIRKFTPPPPKPDDEEP